MIDQDWSKTKAALLEGLEDHKGKKLLDNVLASQAEFVKQASMTHEQKMRAKPWYVRLRFWVRQRLYRWGLVKHDPKLDDFRNIMIPMIRRIIPTTIAHDIVSAQPMTGDEGKVYQLKYRYGDPATEVAPVEGARRHVFGQGYEVYYGNEWIAQETYLKIKRAGL